MAAVGPSTAAPVSHRKPAAAPGWPISAAWSAESGSGERDLLVRAVALGVHHSHLQEVDGGGHERRPAAVDVVVERVVGLAPGDVAVQPTAPGARVVDVRFVGE